MDLFSRHFFTFTSLSSKSLPFIPNKQVVILASSSILISGSVAHCHSSLFSIALLFNILMVGRELIIGRGYVISGLHIFDL